MSGERKKLEAEIRERRERIYAIDEAARLKRNRTLIGKCFKYRNSYGSGERWWLYAKITHLDDSNYPVGLRFETLAVDEIRIEPAHPFYTELSDSWQEIEPGEFDAEFAKLKARIAALSQAKPDEGGE